MLIGGAGSKVRFDQVKTFGLPHIIIEFSLQGCITWGGMRANGKGEATVRSITTPRLPCHKLRYLSLSGSPVGAAFLIAVGINNYYVLKSSP